MCFRPLLKEKKMDFFKNKWVWIGLAVIIAIGLYSSGVFTPADVPVDAQ